MNTTESKELAEKLSNTKIIEETIEGVILQKSELLSEISMFLEEEKDYLAYLNPLENDDIVTHILLDGKLIVSFLMSEDEKVKDVIASSQELYIRLDREKYPVNPNEARRFMCSLDQNVVILVRIDNYEGVKAQFLNEC